jgi:hypothetical protein
MNQLLVAGKEVSGFGNGHIEYLSISKECIGYLGNKCFNTATLGQPKNLCEECAKKWEELNERLTMNKTNLNNYIAGEEQMTVYECFCQQKEMTAEDCQNCFKRGMKEKYQTRAACVQDNAEKKEGSTF